MTTKQQQHISERANVPVRKSLGLRLRELRRAAHLSQTALGEKASLSGKFIGEVERGEKSISIDSLSRVAAVLKTTMAAILGFEKMNPATPGAEKIYALMSKQPVKVVNRVVEIVRAAIAA